MPEHYAGPSDLNRNVNRDTLPPTTTVALMAAMVAAMVAVMVAVSMSVWAAGVGSANAITTAGTAAEESVGAIHASGLEVQRTWQIAGGRRPTLSAKITLTNDTTNSISTELIEPVPTSGVRGLRFANGSKPASRSPGIARFKVSVRPGASRQLRYAAVLTADRTTTAQERILDLKTELESALAAVPPAASDTEAAAYLPFYGGTVTFTEELTDGVEILPEDAALGKSFSTNLRLNAVDPLCIVPTRSCAFDGHDQQLREPPLGRLTPTGSLLTGSATATTSTAGFTCDGLEMPTDIVMQWSIEPTKVTLTWAGWSITEIRYSWVRDESAQQFVGAEVRCRAGNAHQVVLGTLSN